MENMLLGFIKKTLVVVGLILIVVLVLFGYSALIYGRIIPDFGSWNFAMNDNYFSGLVTVIVSIVAIALPLSISVITQSKETIFNSKEMAESFYKEPKYKSIKNSVFFLIILVTLSYFEALHPILVIITTIASLRVVYQFFKYMEIVEAYVSDFAQMVINQEKKNVDRIF